MNDDEVLENVTFDTELNVQHLNWEIPTVIRIQSNGDYYINNAHGGRLYEVTKEEFTAFINDEINVTNQHIEYLKAIQKLLAK